MRVPFYPILIGLAAIAAPAMATPITVTPANVGSSYTVGYDGYSDGRVIDGLTGQVTLTLAEVVDNSYKFDYTVTNTSSDPIDASRISIFGFNTDPNILDATSTGLFDQTATTANVPTGFGQVDLCFKGAGGNNCSGGAGEGVNIGSSASGTLTLNFSDPLDQLTLSDFFVRYQAIEGAGSTTSAIGRGTATPTGSTGGSTGGTPIPAPAALWLFAAGLGVLGLRVGRIRRASSATA